MKLQILSLCLLFDSILHANEVILNDQNDLIIDRQDESIAESDNSIITDLQPFSIPSETALTESQSLNVAMPNTLNTLGEDDSGNWVLKRVWWEKAENVFGKIMALNLQICQQQMEYFGIRNEIDKELDGRKRELNLSLEELDKTITRLLELVDQGQDLAELDLKNDVFKGSVLENKDKLLKLKDDISKLNKLDSDLDNAIIKVIDQVQKCNDYEASAWSDFKQIGRVLNDEVAKNLYYQVANYRKNIKMILGYLKVDLHASFEMLMAHAVTVLDEIKAAVIQLRKSGIDLVYESKIRHEEARYSDESSQTSQQQDSQSKNKWHSFQFLSKTLGFLRKLGDLFWSLLKTILGWVGIKF